VPTWLSPYQREVLWRRRRRALIALLLAFLLLLIFDTALYRLFIVAPAPDPYHGTEPLLQAEFSAHQANFQATVHGVEGRDFYRTFRVAGTLWPWLFICGAIAAHALWSRPRLPRLAGSAAMILLSALASGAAAEALRILTGRLRPIAADPRGTHQFKGFLERFGDPSDLAFPSSHAAVAFGAAFMIAFVFPRAGAVALLVATGCGITRMLTGAHFASDVFAAALVGYAVARLLSPGGWRGLNPRPLLP
jgi:membrane-associated phospholipid phosphatase